MIALDERSWLCSGPEIWPNHFFYQLKSESEDADPWGGGPLEHARLALVGGASVLLSFFETFRSFIILAYVLYIFIMFGFYDFIYATI